jgi:hypothetical protein
MYGLYQARSPNTNLHMLRKLLICSFEFEFKLLYEGSPPCDTKITDIRMNFNQYNFNANSIKLTKVPSILVASTILNVVHSNLIFAPSNLYLISIQTNRNEI